MTDAKPAVQEWDPYRAGDVSAKILRDYYVVRNRELFTPSNRGVFTPQSFLDTPKIRPPMGYTRPPMGVSIIQVQCKRYHAVDRQLI